MGARDRVVRRCVEQRRKPEQGTGEQASLALRVSLAAARSLESGRPEAVWWQVLERVLARVDARRDDAVELLEELVRINSVNPSSRESTERT